MYINQRPLLFFLSSLNLQSTILVAFLPLWVTTLFHKHTFVFIKNTEMLSFRSIFVAAAAFATVFSAVPMPDVDSRLVQRTSSLGGLLSRVPFDIPINGNIELIRSRDRCRPSTHCPIRRWRTWWRQHSCQARRSILRWTNQEMPWWYCSHRY